MSIETLLSMTPLPCRSPRWCTPRASPPSSAGTAGEGLSLVSVAA